MGAREVESLGLGPVTVSSDVQRRAALHIADRIAAQHPHVFDEFAPTVAGRLIGRDPVIAAGLRELADALGIPGTVLAPSLEQIGKRIRFAACLYTVAARAHIAELEQALRTTRDFAASDAAGYIDRTGVEAS